MKAREKILQELNRRSSEISWFQDRDITNQDSTQSFFSGIADYINYIKLQPTLNSFVEELKKDNSFKDIDNELVKEGNTIIEKVKVDFKTIRLFIRRNKFTILSWDNIFPTTGVGTLNADQSISLMYLQVEGFLKKDNQFIGDIPNLITNLWSLLGRIEVSGKTTPKLKKIYESYKEIYRSYEDKLKDKDILIHYLRLEDYQKLNEVWSYYYDKSIVVSHFGMMFHELVNEKRTIPSLSQEQLRLVGEYKTKYLLWLHRFHNYLTDRLEETDWAEAALRWFWENFGKVIVAIYLYLFVLWVLRKLGVNAPTEFNLNFLK